VNEEFFRDFWSRKTDSDHPPRPGIDVFPIGAGEIQGFLPKPPARVLEIGCGAGELFQHLSLDRSAYLGVDFSESMLATFRARHPGVRVVHGEATTFFVEETFDFILVNNVIQYCRPWMTSACVKNLARMLAPGGRILLGNVPNRRQRLAYVRRRFAPESAGPLRWLWRLVRGLAIVALSDTDSSVGFWYTPPEIARIAASAGLDAAIFGCVLYPYRFSALLTHRAPRGLPGEPPR
jgi:SAM-dependent methyltransferase